MSWAVGYDTTWRRDIGYGVPALCDYPGCGAEIDRGLAYVCGNEPYGGEDGCGLFFCPDHGAGEVVCTHPFKDDPAFTPTADVPEWIERKLTDESWAEWRASNESTTTGVYSLEIKHHVGGHEAREENRDA
jgi:hypothetical protein